MKNFKRNLRTSLGLLLLLTISLIGWSEQTQRAQAAQAATIWASPTGQGTTCSQSAPCALTTAQSQADLLATTTNGDVTVNLLSGTYHLSQPLTFTSSDSGVNGYNIIYTGYASRPVLSGGMAITGWSLSDAAHNIWSAAVPASLNTRQLYVNGARAQVAQGNPPVTLTQDSAQTGFIAGSNALAKWRNPSDLEFVFPGGNGSWTETRCRVASIADTMITMRQPCWGNSINRNVNANGGFTSIGSYLTPARIENAYELLTQPGQWYLDSSLHELYYIPLPGQNIQTADVEAPVLQTLVQGNGTLNAPVQHLIFRNLQFSYATWLRPNSNDGFSEMQANYTLTGNNAGQTQGLCEYTTPQGTCPFAAFTQTPANVIFQAAQSIQFEGNLFTHLGAAGLELEYGSQNNLVVDNEFTDISGTGLQLGNVNDAHPSDVGAGNNEITSGNTIEDNWFHQDAVEYHGGSGIVVGYTQHTLITHNQFNDLPYDGLDFGWGGWNTNSNNPTADTNIAVYNTISNNLVFNYKTVLSDGGGIYTNGLQGTTYADGLQETGNVVYDQHNINWALYNDRGSAYVTLNGNAEWASPKGYGGCAPVGHIVLENNYLADSIQIGGGCGPYPIDITQTNNTTISDNPTPGQVPNSLLSNAGIEASYASLVTQYGPSVEAHYPNTGTANATTNILITGSGFTSNDSVTFAGTQATGINILSPNFLIATVASGTNLQSVSVVSTSTLATAFNNIGITDDTNQAPGNFDASGYSYSAQALAAAGATPGASIIHHGLSFTWPNVTAGSSDNVIAQGQSITLSGSGDTLGFLLTGVTYSPPATGSGTIVYGDGTQQAFTLSAPNWYFTDSGTGDQALVLPYRNNANGPQDHHQVVVYYVGVSLQSNKTVAQVILPNLGSTLLPSLRIFAIALGYQSLATAFNNVGISNDATASQANFDSFGYSYSAQALAAAGATPGASIIHHGLSFTWPNVAAGNPDNVIAQGQSITLSGSGDTLGFLLTGVTYSPPATGSGTIVYSDGTQQAFTLSAPNWGCSSGDQVLALLYRNTSSGTQDQYAVCVYYASVALQSGKTVAQVILPNLGSAPLPSLRIFAISIGNHS